MSGLTSCPKCAGRVSVPEAAEESAWVRCPICGAEYPLRRVLEYRPPVLEVIDEPAIPSEGRPPSWGAVAAAAPTPMSEVSEIAAVASDSAAVEESEVIAVLPLGTHAPTISSAEISGGSDVITFDDSLLLDEPTDELPPQPSVRGGEAAVASAAGQASDDDFFKIMSGDSAADDRAQAAEAIDWTAEDTLEPYESGEIADQGQEAEEFRLRDEESQSARFEPARAAASEVSAPPIGLAPRRRSRRGSPLVMVGGIVGGGVFGLAIGYAILMWGFSKDPFALAAKLPAVLVPASLQSPSNQRIAQSVRPNEGVNAGDSSSSGNVADAGGKPDDSFPAFGGDKGVTDRNDSGDKDSMPGGLATEPAADRKNVEGDAFARPAIDPFVVNNKSAKEDAQGSSPTTNPYATDRIAVESQKDTKETPADLRINPFDAAKTDAKSEAGKTSETKDPLADPFSDLDKTGPKKTTADDPLKDPFAPDVSEAKSDPLADPFGPKAGASEQVDAAAKRAARSTFYPNLDPNVGPEAEKLTSENELRQAIEAAKETTAAAMALPADAPQSEKNEANRSHYVNLSKVAEAVSTLDVQKVAETSKDGGVADYAPLKAAEQAVLAAVPDRSKLDELGKLSGYFFKSSSSKGGIILAGAVIDSKQRGKVFESVVETPGNKVPITVVSPMNLTERFGKNIVVLGTIIANGKLIQGYDGAAAKVVWAAMAIDPTAVH